MANQQIFNNEVTQIPLDCELESTQAAEAWPSGVSFTAAVVPSTSASASVVALAPGGQSWVLQITPLVQQSLGMVVSWNVPGMLGGSITLDLVANPNTLQAIADTNQSHWTTTLQAIPTAPGP